MTTIQLQYREAMIHIRPSLIRVFIPTHTIPIATDQTGTHSTWLESPLHLETHTNKIHGVRNILMIATATIPVMVEVEEEESTMWANRGIQGGLVVAGVILITHNNEKNGLRGATMVILPHTKNPNQFGILSQTLHTTAEPPLMHVGKMRTTLHNNISTATLTETFDKGTSMRIEIER